MEPDVRKAIFFDVETTGLSRKNDRLVQLAWILGDLNGETELACRDFIIKPEGFQIPKRVSQIHGIDTDTAHKNGVELRDVLEIFKEDMAQAEILIGHNVSFDIGMISSEFTRYQLNTDILEKPSICTMRLSTAWCRLPKFNGGNGFKWPSLQELHFKLFGAHFDDAHDALADIRATQKCYKELVKQKIIVIPPDMLTPYLNSAKKPNFLPLEPSAKVNAKSNSTKEIPKSFLKAIEEDDVEAVLYGIKNGININEIYQDGTPPIHWAVWDESLQVLNILMANGASLNQRCLDGTSILCGASMKTLPVIFESFSDVDARNILGATPLHYHCLISNAEIVKFLLSKGADPHAKCPYFEKAIACIEDGTFDPEDMNLANEMRDPVGQSLGASALHFATVGCMGIEEFNNVLPILLDAGLSIDVIDQFGRTPLMVALGHFDKEVAEILLKNGANPEIQDNEGNNVLHHLCANYSDLCAGYGGSHVNSFKQYIWSIGDLTKFIHVENNLGLTPLDCLCTKSSPCSAELIKILIEAGANPFHQNKFGKTAWELMSNLPHFKNSQVYWDINQKRFT